MMQLATAILASLFFVAGCATTTRIESRPQGARAYVEERYLGETPVKYKDSSVFWTKKKLVLKKEGYREKEVELAKDELRTGPLIGTILIVVPPVFWLFGYPDEVIYELEPL